MAKSKATPPDFEASMAELERIVTAMETGQMPLNQALASYEHGIALLRQCRQILDAAETQLRSFDADGNHVAVISDDDQVEGESAP